MTDDRSESCSALPSDASVRALLSPLMPLLALPGVTELAVNEPQQVFLETDDGWQEKSIPELTHERLQSLAVAIGQYSRQQISEAAPILSATLPDGERIQVILPPAVEPGRISLTIRKPSTTVLTLDQYEARGLFEGVRLRQRDAYHGAAAGYPSPFQEVEGDLGDVRLTRRRDTARRKPVDAELEKLFRPETMAAFFSAAVRARKNILVVGDTGSGKTTFMKALCQYIPLDERLVTIEDVRELLLKHRNRVHLLYSKGDQGVAKVSVADLIAAAMRMKPSRVLLAELRGSEAYDYLKLMTTGHSGSITSLHATNPEVGLERFVLMAKEHPEARAYENADLRRLLEMTADVVCHVEAQGTYDATDSPAGKRRRMTEVLW